MIFIENINEILTSLLNEGDKIAKAHTKERSDGSFYISGKEYRIWHKGPMKGSPENFWR
ncbi:hypothetical protein MsAc7_10100 [Methanolapillus millepedarum]|uniref:Uncharacterized protein n=1 Tax=Methanolapillus millepedarum TaxID=3028296 RepID=A0AA96V5K9_9EURY|nr:hypothetical protein MsAc7_10100 [Methanosarcinaceae archaeon Ac7]